MNTTKASGDSPREINLDEVATLIDALERDLQKIQGSPQDVQRLKDEV